MNYRDSLQPSPTLCPSLKITYASVALANNKPLFHSYYIICFLPCLPVAETLPAQSDTFDLSDCTFLLDSTAEEVQLF